VTVATAVSIRPLNCAILAVRSVNGASAARCSGPTPPNAAAWWRSATTFHARIAEAEREGWLGEVEGLRVSLVGAEDKLTQLNRRRDHRTAVDLGIPTPKPAPRPDHDCPP
jgi:hypothetical protein